MKIIDNTATKVTFDSLKYGDVFKGNHGYSWIKIREIEDSGCTAIALDDGEPGFFEDNEEITPLPNARLVID